MTNRVRTFARDNMTSFLMLIVAAVCWFPIWWCFSSSLKGKRELYVAVPSLVPRSPTLGNYAYIIRYMGRFPRYALNSAFVCLATVVISVVVASLAGYAFARIDFRGRDLIFITMILLMFIPHAGGLMAQYELLHALHLRNNLWGLILHFSAGISTSIFIMRQTFLTLPGELEDAARIDGAGRWQLFWRIAVPMSTAGMTLVAIFQFIGAWGDYLFTLTMIDKDELFTLAVAVQRFYAEGAMMLAGDYSTYGALSAGYLLTSAPVMIMFILLQKWFIRGLLEGALKF